MGKPGVECKGPDTPKPLESDSCCYPGALLSALTSVVSTECRGAWLVPFQPSPQPSSPRSSGSKMRPELRSCSQDSPEQARGGKAEIMGQRKFPPCISTAPKCQPKSPWPLHTANETLRGRTGGPQLGLPVPTVVRGVGVGGRKGDSRGQTGRKGRNRKGAEGGRGGQTRSGGHTGWGKEEATPGWPCNRYC